MLSMFIDDGYTIDATIPAKGRMPALKITYRPPMPGAIAEYRIQYNRANDGNGKVMAASKLIADHLHSWDATDREGKAAPITTEMISKIPEGRRDEIMEEIMWGFERREAAEKN
jgi:hypothetical protein